MVMTSISQHFIATVVEALSRESLTEDSDRVVVHGTMLDTFTRTVTVASQDFAERMFTVICCGQGIQNISQSWISWALSIIPRVVCVVFITLPPAYGFVGRGMFLDI